MEKRMDDDILFAPVPLGPRVVSVHTLPDFRIGVAFDNGERREFDVKPLLDYPAFAPLRNETFFHLARVQFGTVCWPGDIDLCPDTLYAQSVPA